MQKNTQYPNILQAIYLIFSLTFLQVFLGVLVKVVYESRGINIPTGDPGIIGIINLVSFSLILVLGIQKSRSPSKDILKFRTHVNKTEKGLPELQLHRNLCNFNQYSED